MPINKKRPIDELATESYSMWDKGFVFIKKEKIKLWYVFISFAFVTGMITSLAWSVSTNVHQSSRAEIVNTCSDGTPHEQCSSTIPKYCLNGTLIDDCSLCSCDTGSTCRNMVDYILDYPSMIDIKQELESRGDVNILKELYNLYDGTISNGEKEILFSGILDNYPLLTGNEKKWLKSLTHIIWVEANNIVPWSIKDYTNDEILILVYPLSAYFNENGTISYTTLYGGSYDSPEIPISIWLEGTQERDYGNNLKLARIYNLFLLSNSLKNESKDRTIENIVQWTEKNFFHAYFEYGWDVYDDRDNRTMDEVFRERVVGCKDTSVITASMLRSINIPSGSYGTAGGHDMVYFPESELFVHGDYLAQFPAIPAHELIMDQEELFNWIYDVNGYNSYRNYLNSNQTTLYGFIELFRENESLYLKGYILPNIYIQNENYFLTSLSEYDTSSFIEGGLVESNRVPIKTLNQINEEITLEPRIIRSFCEEPASIGEQKIVILMVNFQNTPVPNITKTEVENLIFNQTNDFYQEVSYGKVFLTGDVFGWYTIPMDIVCGEGIQIQNEALNAADADVDFTQYQRLILIYPDGCSSGSVAAGSVGKQTISTPDGTLEMSYMRISAEIEHVAPIFHEFGHNLGVGHSNFLDCGDLTIDSGSCNSVEYGDPYDVMGVNALRGHLNAPHKESLGWFNPSNILTINTSGTFILEPMETATNGLKALKIPRGNDNYLYVEYRQPIGYDATFEQKWSGIDVYEGAILHILNSNSPLRPLLIDPTPPSHNRNIALYVGNSFIDPVTGTTITVIDRTDTALTVTVTNQAATGQTPWSSNAEGTLGTGYNWTSMIGYHFTPQTDGIITQLGGFFDGTTSVKLWKNDTTELLAEVDVTALTSAGEWTFVNIPDGGIAVQAGVKYTVAGYLHTSLGVQGSQRSLSRNYFPKTFDDISIHGTTYKYADAMPTNLITNMMFGQVDINFVPGGGGSGPVCGNSTVEPGEECDDGNTMPLDGCDASCQNEYCGDGIINNSGTEQCDDGNTIPLDGCDAFCQNEYCGDGIIQAPNADGIMEQCDDGNIISGDGCSATCQIEQCQETCAVHGDCDDGDVNTNDQCINSCCEHTPIASTGQTPWSSNAEGTLGTGYNWTSMIGYHFTPQTDGIITQLGGFFDGTTSVKLWKNDTTELLAEADVTALTSAGEWTFVDIPDGGIAVQAGTKYTVAGYLHTSLGVKASSRILTTNYFPKTFEDIIIHGTTYVMSNAMPNNLITNRMYGQVDINFVPEGN